MNPDNGIAALSRPAPGYGSAGPEAPWRRIADEADGSRIVTEFRCRR